MTSISTLSAVDFEPNLELWKLRVNAGLSRTELASRARTTSETIRRCERGHVPSPKLQRNIAHVFRREPLDLFPSQPGVGAL